MRKERAKELVTSPVAVLAAVGSLIGSIGFGLFDPAWALISTTSGMWFPAISVTSGVLLPELGYGDIGTTVLMGAAIIFVAVQLDRLWDRAAEWRKNR